MNFYKWSSVEPLRLNKFGIPEPISEENFSKYLINSFSWF